MITVVEVKNKRQRKKFVDFPTKLYKGNDYYVHPLRMDEFAIFVPNKNVAFDECDMVFYLAYKDGHIAGRICGVVQKVYNAKNNAKKVRFTRFDCIEDFEVAKALLEKIEDWARMMGMDTIHGPLGFHDLEREGLLIEGFDELATFEENYNYPYYREYLEKLGYIKDIDYMSFAIKLPEKTDERIVKIGDMIMKRYNLRIATAKNKKEYINKYKDGIFDLLNESYGDLYGVIPYNEKLKKQIIDQFNLIINLEYLITILDENDRVVAFGFGLPSIARSIQKCKGRLLPTGLFRILHDKNHCKLADFGLIGVRKELQGKGIPAVILNYIVTMAKQIGVERIETNHSLENNYKILQTWKNFEDVRQHKRYRVFTKDLNKKEQAKKSIKKKTNTTKKTVKKTSTKKTNKTTNKKLTSKK